MWRGLTHLFSHLTELAALLREQNSLLRELLFAQMHRPAQTPLTKHSLTPPPPAARRKYTAADVTVVTPALREQQAIDVAVKQQMPWRDPMETLAAIEEQQQQSQPRPLTPPV